MKERDIQLREENRIFYENLEDQEEDENRKLNPEKSKYELMAEQARLESEVSIRYLV